MSLECPHCEEDLDAMSRTGEKRYACDSCNKVVKYDYIKPELDNIDVTDKRDSTGSSNDNSGGDSGGQSGEGEPSPPEDGEPSHDLNEREIIYERGREGLKEIKKERLRNWLGMTDNVGSKTENRIMMVFNSDDLYSENPNALYNLLEDEISASSSYINTVVNNVFAPEHEHQEVLEQQNYEPWFRQSNNGGGGGRGNHSAQGANMRRPNGGGGGNGGGNQQFNQQQQSNQNNGGGGMSRDEAVELISTAVNESEDSGGGGLGSSAAEGLDEATNEAIRNMAQNMGGFFNAGQEMIREALVSYAKENPELIVENMDLFQAFLDSGDDGQQEQQKPQQDAAVDNAVQQARTDGHSPAKDPSSKAGFEEGGPSADSGPEDLRDPKREPRDESRSTGMSASPKPEEHAGDSEFEPSDSIMSDGEQGENEKETDDDRASNAIGSNGNDNEEGSEEGFDELFGDVQ